MNVWLKLIILNCKVQCHQMIMADRYIWVLKKFKFDFKSNYVTLSIFFALQLSLHNLNLLNKSDITFFKPGCTEKKFDFFVILYCSLLILQIIMFDHLLMSVLMVQN